VSTAPDHFALVGSRVVVNLKYNSPQKPSYTVALLANGGPLSTMAIAKATIAREASVTLSLPDTVPDGQGLAIAIQSDEDNVSTNWRAAMAWRSAEPAALLRFASKYSPSTINVGLSGALPAPSSAPAHATLYSVTRQMLLAQIDLQLLDPSALSDPGLLAMESPDPLRIDLPPPGDEIVSVRTDYDGKQSAPRCARLNCDGTDYFCAVTPIPCR
jgi:hypothetical protein